MSDAVDRPLDWEDPIENDGTDYVIIPPGEYDFEVLKLERARWAGNAKSPACNKAVVHIGICDGNGNQIALIKHNIFLNTKNEWQICQFFRSIGMRKHGEKFVMNWAAIVGKTGRCKVVNKKEKDKKDESKETTYNNIDKFLDPPEDAPAPAATTPPTFNTGDF